MCGSCTQSMSKPKCRLQSNSREMHSTKSLSAVTISSLVDPSVAPSGDRDFRTNSNASRTYSISADSLVSRTISGGAALGPATNGAPSWYSAPSAAMSASGGVPKVSAHDWLQRRCDGGSIVNPSVADLKMYANQDMT